MISNELEFHAFCLTDTGSRLDQFAAAIAARIKPGDTVVDLGAGSGILSFLACRAGARRVYAIESGESLEFARLLAARNGFLDRIEFIGKPSTQVVLAERVDAIVGDIHDTFGLQARGLTSIVDARERFLTPAGTIIPRSIRLMTAAIEAPDVYEKTIEVWHSRIQGVDISPMRWLAVNQPTAARIEPSQCLAEPAPLATIDLMRVTQGHVNGTTELVLTRDGTLHGICGCFVTTLVEGVQMGNVPGDSGTTNFAQAFFPLESPTSVRAGDRIAVRLETHDSIAARWQVDVTRDGASIARFDHSTLHAGGLPVQALRKQGDDYRPTLTSLGTLERELLDRFDGVHTAADLVAWLATRTPAVLPSAHEAAAFLKQAIERYG
jgi:type I protein arginine methyltransferase